MICAHQTITRKIIGNEAECILCHLPVIFDGSRWVWLYSIGVRKRDQYKAQMHRQLRREEAPR